MVTSKVRKITFFVSWVNIISFYLLTDFFFYPSMSVFNGTFNHVNTDAFLMASRLKIRINSVVYHIFLLV